jgi:hypothetical protein
MVPHNSIFLLKNTGCFIYILSIIKHPAKMNVRTIFIILCFLICCSSMATGCPLNDMWCYDNKERAYNDRVQLLCNEYSLCHLGSNEKIMKAIAELLKVEYLRQISDQDI